MAAELHHLRPGRQLRLESISVLFIQVVESLQDGGTGDLEEGVTQQSFNLFGCLRHRGPSRAEQRLDSGELLSDQGGFRAAQLTVAIQTVLGDETARQVHRHPVGLA